jgi:hypothetical protein
MALEKEFETYKSKLPELREEQGKFALIHGETLVGVYSAYEDALKAGYERLGLVPFLVKQIQAIEQVQFISRLTAPTCPISLSNARLEGRWCCWRTTT